MTYCRRADSSDDESSKITLTTIILEFSEPAPERKNLFSYYSNGTKIHHVMFVSVYIIFAEKIFAGNFFLWKSKFWGSWTKRKYPTNWNLQSFVPAHGTEFVIGAWVFREFSTTSELTVHWPDYEELSCSLVQEVISVSTSCLEVFLSEEFFLMFS